MEKIQIKGDPREITTQEKAKKIRKQGFIPAIIYGKKTNQSIKIPIAELKVLRAHRFSESALVEIVMDHSAKDQEPVAAVIKDVQFHPLTEEVIHIDFLKVSMKEKIRVRVPLVLKGEPAAVKDGAILEHLLREVEIEAFPMDLPEAIEVDVSSLELGDSIHVGSLNVGEKIKILSHTEDTIAILAAKEEEPEEPPAEAAIVEGAAPAEPEVIKEKKPQEGQKEKGKEKE
ncbi:MAG: 50S ribosomal protein L25 [Candidatus Omnitrophica bacterium]|nr:50S ribosomal protein L25 [Candidatus Omnitrophota bacterium]